MTNLAKTVIGLHLAEKKPMQKSCVLAVFKLIELGKSIQFAYNRNWQTVVDCFHHILQQGAVQLLKILLNAKVKDYNC